jgi:hypothetical protein
MMQNSPVSQKDTGKIDGSLLHSKTPKFLAVLIIFFASTQLGYHFWPLSSLVYGIRIDYLSPTLYFLDLVLILNLIISRGVGINKLVPILPILLTNLLFSQNPLSTLSWSLHLLLYSSFIFSLKADTIKIIPKILLISLVFQLVLGLFQFYLGRSVGGFMYYFGERMVSVGSPGIATTSFMGEVVLRAYGTFSHPNIFAGWSVIVLLIMLRLRPQLKTFAILLTTTAIFLTNSRSAALALFGVVIPFYLIQKTKTRIIYFIVSLLIGCFVLLNFSLPRTDLSTSERLNLQGVSLQVISHFPIFGTGSQSSISTYPPVSSTTRLLQPDHNSFTLFLSWFGIAGLSAVIYLFSRIHGFTVIRIILPLFPLIFLDHYLLTSPQGLFFLLFYLQIALNYSHAQKDRQ